MLVKQINSFSYEQLAFHRAHSSCYRRFSRMGIGDRPPKKSTLQKSIKRVRAETWAAINDMAIRSATAAGVETGDRSRTDCTAIESDVHDPTDSTLLRDSERVLARGMETAREEFEVSFKDRRRRAKRRMAGILTATTGGRGVILLAEKPPQSPAEGICS